MGKVIFESVVGNVACAFEAGHATKPVLFSLVVDDFGVKYIDKENADHLIQALQKLYTISIDWNGSLLCGPIHSISRIMSNVMGSASKADIGAAYINGQEAVPICTLLHKMGHPQPATPIQVDNSTTDGFANDTIKQKRSKAIDMRFYWIHDQTSQGQFLIYWKPGITNLRNYCTKHHSPAHHQLMQPTYLHISEELAQSAIAHILRGCVNSRVPKTVRHGTSLHRICPKILIDSSHRRL